jgi:hypothetical protein
MQRHGFFRGRRRWQVGAGGAFSKFMATNDGVAIVEAMLKIKDKTLRRKVIDIAEKLAEA